MTPFLFFTLKEIVDEILRMVILKDILENCDTLQKLLQLDLHDVTIRRKKPNLNIGAKTLVKSYQNNKNFNQNALNKFYKEDCGIFYTNLISHLLEKSPIRRLVVRCSSSLDPKLMNAEEESSSPKFDFLCARLAELQRITKMEAEDASDE